MMFLVQEKPGDEERWKSDVFRLKVGFIAPSLREGHDQSQITF